MAQRSEEIVIIMRSRTEKHSPKVLIFNNTFPFTSHNVILVIKEQLYLPTVLVEVGYLLGCQRSRVFGCKVTNSSPLTLETAHKRLIFNDFKERLVHFNGTVV